MRVSIDRRSVIAFDASAPVVKGQYAALILVGSAIGALFGAVVAPLWLPDVVASLLGPSPKAFWYISRSTAMVAYLLLWLSMVFGLLISGKLSRIWPGGPAAVDLHQFTALLGLAFGMFHAAVLLGDRFIGYGAMGLLIPFAGQSYRPLAVGLGQIGLYLGLVLTLTFYLRRRIGYRMWRLIHFGSFAFYFLSTIHGLTAGTDAADLLPMYVITTLVTLFLTLFRILSSVNRVIPLESP
jgi:predicted ferric reductase